MFGLFSWKNNNPSNSFSLDSLPLPESSLKTKHAKILNDTEDDPPTSDFDKYSKTIANLVKFSDPHFTVGIYGEWGTGKTTLMKKIRKDLGWKEQEEIKDFEYNNTQKIVTVWFNAWRYEREEHFATIALMRTIAYAIAKHPKFSDISSTILRGLKIIGMDVLQGLTTKYVMSAKGWGKLEKGLSEKTEFLNKLDKDTIYFDGLSEIKKQIQEIRNVDPDYRIVVFIDDLDRCSPKKALEVLESVKVFLDIEGFVYVIGLSIKTVASLITHDYKATGIKGEDYIKKIIQIPFRIPSWNKVDIREMIPELSKNLTTPYDEYARNFAYVITDGVESNPREIKRFLNNLIVALEVLRLEKITLSENQFLEIAVLEVLRVRWPEFYSKIIDYGTRGILYFPKTEIELQSVEQLLELKRNDKQNDYEESLIKVQVTNLRYLIEAMPPESISFLTF